MSEEHSALLMRFGVDIKPGPTSHAVVPELIRYLSESVKSDYLTIETGGGHTTVAFAALAKHHTCVTVDESNVELTKKYMSQIGIPEEKVTFVLESSDTALPKLTGTFDFAFVDGNHSYPFPALDWHYIDKRLKIGGVIGLDNTEIRAVYEHCLFLEENKTYTFTREIRNTVWGGNYGASFYIKVKDDERETFYQPYNLRRAKPLTFRERVKEVLKPQKKVWPWD
jgi:predicted O-methyltransferase YrrM